MINVAWHELLSWGLVILSATLFIVERRKNDPTKYFNMLQGLLQASWKRSQLYANLSGELNNNPEREIPFNEHLLFLKTVYSEQNSLMQHIMGYMKSIDPGNNISFNVDDFLGVAKPVSKSERTEN